MSLRKKTKVQIKQELLLRPYSFRVDRHTIIRGDCLTVLQKMKDRSVDVFITSPPYNLGIVYSAYQDKKGEAEYLDWLEKICFEIKRVMKDDASFFLNHTYDLRCRGDVWFIPYDTIRKKSEKFNHPGTFPIALPQMCLRLHGRKNPVVVDPFMGTGTTLLAAHYEGGRAIGMDIDKNYVKIAKERLEKAVLTK